MKNGFGWLGIMLAAMALFSANVRAETGHYVNGVEGIKAATIPPPGSYYRMYNTFYAADTLTGADGEELDVGFDAMVFANVHRFIWITQTKLLGADYGFDIFIPLIYQDIEISALGIDNDEFGLGDIIVEPLLLSWHGKRWDTSAGAAVYLPTGDSDNTNPASPGKGFYTAMFSLGATYYLDAKKTWSASVLSRYEIHTEKDDDEITPGDDFHFEWGLGKTFPGKTIWEVGLAGYCHWQVSDDSGGDVTWDEGVHDRVFAVGPHISAFIPTTGTVISLMNEWEFEAKDRPEGSVTTLSLIKFF